jgi:acetyltransferase-like isoleucine patch superfamily enzyme
MKFLLDLLDAFQMWFLKNFVSSMPTRYVKLVAFYHPDPYLRKMYYARLGVRMGENTLANLGLTVTRNRNEVCLDIGNNVSIAPNVTFITDSCANNGMEINTYPYVSQKLQKTMNIKVEDEVWIGAGAIIFPGVTLGRCSVIGAGSVITEDTEAYWTYAGVPAKKIRDIRSPLTENK